MILETDRLILRPWREASTPAAGTKKGLSKESPFSVIFAILRLKSKNACDIMYSNKLQGENNDFHRISKHITLAFGNGLYALPDEGKRRDR